MSSAACRAAAGEGNGARSAAQNNAAQAFLVSPPPPKRGGAARRPPRDTLNDVHDAPVYFLGASLEERRRVSKPTVLFHHSGYGVALTSV